MLFLRNRWHLGFIGPRKLCLFIERINRRGPALAGPKGVVVFRYLRVERVEQAFSGVPQENAKSHRGKDNVYRTQISAGRRVARLARGGSA